MKYSGEEIIQYVLEEDIKFIRLVFCDVFGMQKNVSIMPTELRRAFEFGIAVDASAVKGFGGEIYSDLLLHPDPDTLCALPWRPEHGRVVRMFCSITYPDGTPFESDVRSILAGAVAEAESEGYSFSFGSEMEFYLFNLDENGNPTKVPYDKASYMDIAPEDKGENVRREICLTLEEMGIRPEASHHEEGPGQNEIDFRYSDAMSAADNAMTFSTVVRTIAARNGLVADFSAKPLPDAPGNGLHINMSVESKDGRDVMPYVIAGVLDKVKEMTLFLNPTEESYMRLGNHKAPRYISWSHENRSQLIRIPAAYGEYKRAELRSADPSANSYLIFALIIHAALHGIRSKLELPKEANLNFYTADKETLAKFEMLPGSLKEAAKLAKESEFIRSHLPEKLVNEYCN